MTRSECECHAKLGRIYKIIAEGDTCTANC